MPLTLSFSNIQYNNWLREKSMPGMNVFVI